MSLRDQPYLPLYVQDFLTDEKLIECSAESTGVYIRIMCIMHKSHEYGKILLKQKDKQSTEQILNFAYKFARQMPYPIDVIERSLRELIEEGVLTLDGDMLYQRRMVKDNEISTLRAISGKKGGEKTASGRGKKDGFASDFAIAKSEANTEIEYETENDTDIDHKPIGIIEERFNIFWKLYPNKKAKQTALKAWKKIKPGKELFDRIIEAVERQKTSEDWTKENGKYIPHPATWLNGGRWDDVEREVLHTDEQQHGFKASTGFRG